jgi:hypothetical protein
MLLKTKVLSISLGSFLEIWADDLDFRFEPNSICKELLNIAT